MVKVLVGFRLKSGAKSKGNFGAAIEKAEPGVGHFVRKKRHKRNAQGEFNETNRIESINESVNQLSDEKDTVLTG